MKTLTQLATTLTHARADLSAEVRQDPRHRDRGWWWLVGLDGVVLAEGHEATEPAARRAAAAAYAGELAGVTP